MSLALAAVLVSQCIADPTAKDRSLASGGDDNDDENGQPTPTSNVGLFPLAVGRRPTAASVPLNVVPRFFFFFSSLRRIDGGGGGARHGTGMTFF